MFSVSAFSRYLFLNSSNLLWQPLLFSRTTKNQSFVNMHSYNYTLMHSLKVNCVVQLTINLLFDTLNTPHRTYCCSSLNVKRNVIFWYNTHTLLPVAGVSENGIENYWCSHIDACNYHKAAALLGLFIRWPIWERRYRNGLYSLLLLIEITWPQGWQGFVLFGVFPLQKELLFWGNKRFVHNVLASTSSGQGLQMNGLAEQICAQLDVNTRLKTLRVAEHTRCKKQ